MWGLLVYKNDHVIWSSVGMQFPAGHRKNLILQMLGHTGSMLQYYHQLIYLQTFFSPQRAKMYSYVLQTTHTNYHQRDSPPCSQNQNEQKQVIKDSCGKPGDNFREKKKKKREIITIHKRMMHFCKNTLEPNERTSVTLSHSSGKTKAVTFAFLVHKSTAIPKAWVSIIERFNNKWHTCFHLYKCFARSNLTGSK